MAVFPAQYFNYSTEYPETGQRVQFGNSYQYDVLPSSPDQRKFIINLKGMTLFVDDDGKINRTVKPERNLATLEDFYNQHKRAVEFTFNHPVYGAVICKFYSPLKIPEPLAGGSGVFPDFQVELIEIP
jgi:hypothetical protein